MPLCTSAVTARRSARRCIITPAHVFIAARTNRTSGENTCAACRSARMCSARTSAYSLQLRQALASSALAIRMSALNRQSSACPCAIALSTHMLKARRSLTRFKRMTDRRKISSASRHFLALSCHWFKLLRTAWSIQEAAHHCIRCWSATASAQVFSACRTPTARML